MGVVVVVVNVEDDSDAPELAPSLGVFACVMISLVARKLASRKLAS